LPRGCIRRRLLLDENAPVGLKAILTGYDVETAPDMGWAGLSNGRLLDAAEAAGFAILVTADRNIRFQQNMAGRTIAMVALTTNNWLTIRAEPAPIIAACDASAAGTCTVVTLARPPRRRRPPPVPAPS
jgi:hypothetical protein